MNAKEIIVDNYLEIARKKDVSKISVNEISKITGISRQGFYYHFTDIYDLLAYTVTKQIKDLIDAYDPRTLYDTLQYLINYSDENRKLLVNAMNSSIRKEVENELHKGLVHLLKNINLSESFVEKSKEDFIVNYHAHAILQILFEYLEGKRPSKDAIINQIVEIVLH